MAEIPENVTLEWIARHLVEFREDTKLAISELNERFDLWTASLRGLRAEVDGLGAGLVRIERLEREQAK